MNNATHLRKHFLVSGQVQGVGFRPFIYRLAHYYMLSGMVANTARGVEIEVQGTAQAVEGFALALTAPFSENSAVPLVPPLAVISSCQSSVIPVITGGNDFVIRATVAGAAGHNVLPSPDVATCDACLADIRNNNNRRKKYAFTNCTNCGPRYNHY